MAPSPRVLVFGLAGIALAALGGCERHEPKNTDPVSTAEKHPEPATKPSSSVASGVIEAPFSAVVPADAQPHTNAGAESSQSKEAGPGNGSTAVGGKTGN